MKKNFWMLVVSLAWLTSCSQSEIVDVPESRVIGFDTYVEKISRSVQNITTADQINYFNVFGYHASHDNGTPSGEFEEEFDNQWVKLTPTSDGSSDYWMNEKAGYWESNQLFRFAAYTNGSRQEKLNATYSAANDVLKIEGYEVTDSTSEPTAKPDLLAAISGDIITTNANTNTDVVFNFRHMLSKVTLVLYNASANMNLHYHNLSIANVNKKGDCSLKYNNRSITTVWDNLSKVENFSFGEQIVVPHPTEGSATYTKHEINFYMIPQSSNKTLTFSTHQVDANGNQAYDKSYSANLSVSEVAGGEDNEWKAGHHYRYIAYLGELGHTISFSVSNIQGWITDINGSGTTDNNDYIELELTERQ